MEALIVVDVQNDFTRGSLKVPGAQAIIPNINKQIAKFAEAKYPIFFTRDWHPSNHVSFHAFGGKWPMHCVRDTVGAEFDDLLLMPPNAVVVAKGTTPDHEAYSGFEGTILALNLKHARVDTVVICGIATDYCVKATAEDALALGFNVRIVGNAVAGVDEADSGLALMSLWQKGAWIEVNA
jgi:nicotinamidase/pyrazinamidase